jgi:hypothetical protein
LLGGNFLHVRCSRPCKAALIAAPPRGENVSVVFDGPGPESQHHFTATEEGEYFLVVDRERVAVTWERTNGARVLEIGEFGSPGRAGEGRDA